MNGFLLVDKPLGVSSFGALQQLNKQFSIQRRSKKVGHGGTLDPYASGLLVIAVGKATRFLRYFLGSDKRYTAKVKFGERTSTDDCEGEVVATGPTEHLNREKLEKALEAFRGKIQQVPPGFSAIHVDGVRAYQLARQGVEVEIPPRDVEIHDISIISCDLPQDREISLDISCSGGTYIRSIARDLGHHLETEAYLSGLRRTSACHFDIAQAHTLDFYMEQEDIEPYLFSCMDAMKHFPAIHANEQRIHRLLRGLPVNFNIAQDGIYTVQYRNRLVAVLERKDGQNDFLRLYSDQEFAQQLEIQT